MILPDVNLLVYAHNQKSRFHKAAAGWWSGAMNGDEPVYLTWVVITGFIRLVTHPSVLVDPLPIDQAFGISDTWMEREIIHIIHPRRDHYRIFRHHLSQLGTGGNLTTDAHLASIAISYQCDLYSNDTDFVRFPGLKWINPLED